MNDPQWETQFVCTEGPRSDKSYEDKNADNFFFNKLPKSMNYMIFCSEPRTI